VNQLLIDNLMNYIIISKDFMYLTFLIELLRLNEGEQLLVLLALLIVGMVTHDALRIDKELLQCSDPQ
jgi:hypothetical protein